MNILKDRKALVTGGTRGIGRAIALRLKAGGAAVTVTGTGVSGAAADPDGMDLMTVDFLDEAATRTFAAAAGAKNFDILILNAGINRVGAFADVDPNDFKAVQQVNVTAPFLIAQAVAPGMRKRGWGRVVGVSSIWGKLGRAGRASYAASKFALDGLMTTLAAEVAVDGVLVNCVAPGFIDTDLTRRVLGEQGMKDVAAMVPMRRLGRAEEIAALVAWLAGPENTYVSGQNIAIDGGFTRV